MEKTPEDRLVDEFLSTHGHKFDGIVILTTTTSRTGDTNCYAATAGNYFSQTELARQFIKKREFLAKVYWREKREGNSNE